MAGCALNVMKIDKLVLYIHSKRFKEYFSLKPVLLESFVDKFKNSNNAMTSSKTRRTPLVQL